MGYTTSSDALSRSCTNVESNRSVLTKIYLLHHFNDCHFLLLASRPFCLSFLSPVAYPPSAAISLSPLFQLLRPYRLVPYSCPCLNTLLTLAGLVFQCCQQWLKLLVFGLVCCVHQPLNDAVKFGQLALRSYPSIAPLVQTFFKVFDKLRKKPSQNRPGLIVNI